MSRIEKALEKAGQLREASHGNEVMQEGAPESSAPPVSTAVFKGEATISVTSPFVVALNAPDSPVAEEYRKLKSMVVKSTNSGKFLNTLMVTSAVGGEGKSLTALNFAISLAQEYDHTVMLVDADLRSPSIHSYLGIEPGIGLSDCLVNGADVGDALVKTGIGKLVFLPAGSKVSNPAEVLSSNKMKEFFKEIKNRYPDRYIIVDTPPVLLFAEAHSIGSMVDGVLFVVKEDQAPLHNIKEALGVLRDTKIVGVVYNGAQANPAENHYYGYKYAKRYR